MVKKTLGYVELEWTCPQCGTRNPGSRKSCSSCGAAQPAKVEFQQAAEEKLITDEAEIARAKGGPDVHCAFCGARNPAGASKCSQCGADLSTATARESGQVLGAHREGPARQVKCPQCGALNDANAFKCARCNASLPRPEIPPAPREVAPAAKKPTRRLGLIGIIGIVLLALLVCGGGALIARSLRPAQEISGQVRAVSWTRSIEIWELQEVTRQAWRDEIPSGAALGPCTARYHHTQDEPAPNATEVCGTPYVIDKGTGHGEVVQDCEYRVYDDWCNYTAQEWGAVDVITLNGADPYPRWPDPILGARQREGGRDETYEVVFETEKGTYTYETNDASEFTQYEIGSRWILKESPLGGVRPIELAR